jgi:hypothetical protein
MIREAWSWLIYPSLDARLTAPFLPTETKRTPIPMTLDPVHFEGIARLAGRIEQGVDEREGRAFAETVWTEFLDGVATPVTAWRFLDVSVDRATAVTDEKFQGRHSGRSVSAGETCIEPSCRVAGDAGRPGPDSVHS